MATFTAPKGARAGRCRKTGSRKKGKTTQHVRDGAKKAKSKSQTSEAECPGEGGEGKKEREHNACDATRRVLVEEGRRGQELSKRGGLRISYGEEESAGLRRKET